MTQLVNIIGPQAAGTAAVIAGISGQFPRGFAVHGPASRALDSILTGRGYEWHLDGGRVVVLEQGATTNETAVLISETTGMVGSPEHGSPDPSKKTNDTHTLKVKCLLQPTIRVAGVVQVQSEEIGNGRTPALFRVLAVEHVLDTHGGEFYSTIDCYPLTTTV